MKKKLFIPCMLLACSLSACESGLVTSGVPYKEGDAAKVADSIKTETMANVRTVKVKSKSKIDLTSKSNDENESIRSKSEINTLIDLSQKSVQIKVTAAAKNNDEVKEYSAKAKAQMSKSGMDVVESSGDYDKLSDSIDFDALYNEAQYDIYSWNYKTNSDDLKGLLSSGYADASSIANDISSNMAIKGDVEKGTFDVGLRKKITGTAKMTVNSTDMDFEFIKLKYSYEDFLIRSIVMELKTEYKFTNYMGQRLAGEYLIYSEANYSYTFNK